MAQCAALAEHTQRGLSSTQAANSGSGFGGFGGFARRGRAPAFADDVRARSEQEEKAQREEEDKRQRQQQEAEDARVQSQQARAQELAARQREIESLMHRNRQPDSQVQQRGRAGSRDWLRDARSNDAARGSARTTQGSASHYIWTPPVKQASGNMPEQPRQPSNVSSNEPASGGNRPRDRQSLDGLITTTHQSSQANSAGTNAAQTATAPASVSRHDHEAESGQVPQQQWPTPQVTPGKLFGSIRLPEGSDSQPAGPPPKPSKSEGLASTQPISASEDALEREIAALAVADAAEARLLAEQNERLRDRRRKNGKKGLEDDAIAEAPEPYLTHGERRRRTRLDREYEEKKRLEEKKDKEAERKRRERERKQAMRDDGGAEDGSSLQTISLPEFISVGNLATALNTRPADFVKQLEAFGFEDVSYSHVLDAETAGLIAAEYGYEARAGLAKDDVEDLIPAPKPSDTSHLPSRPPVVTIMGHVDHGKTTLLDWLRKSSVVSTEHGGITQHIGAFSVTMPSGKVITFLDTPGHAAFLEMRRRGAEVTDIVILVVAADDSVKPQTVEAIKHAKEAGVPMIVAVNKIDLPDTDPDTVKIDLANNGVQVEEQGGDVQCMHVSGKTGQGMIELEEAIVALSEMLDHRAERTGNVEGWLIESTQKRAGKVATVLVTRGTLRPGKIIVAGKAWARVRSLRDESGQLVKKALPGTPVEVDGWRMAPVAGDQVLQAETEQRAKEVVELRRLRDETKELGEDVSAINDARKQELERRKADLTAAGEDAGDDGAAVADGDGSKTAGPRGVPFIVKADVSGSVEAIVNALAGLGNSEVYARVLRASVGPITTSDIAQAAASKADIVSFNMPVDPGLKRLAQTEDVRILDYNVIYEVMDQVTARLSEHLQPNVVHRVTGEAE
ncbi:hypothetical protein KEM52_002705, partial [Ascosphaera acerosa]